jgi:adenylosuccinate lyase
MNHPLSPLDGRYSKKVAALGPIFSEFGLMKYRTIVEIKWLLFLAEKKITPNLSKENAMALQNIVENFDITCYDKIKAIEATTNHDVKAVELFLREYVPENLWSFIHFACTSEDINNTAYGLMTQSGREVVMNFVENLLTDLSDKSKMWKTQPMLCRTHGQTATPSTVGKEFGVFAYRLQRITKAIQETPITAKINGATGTYGAHVVAFPEVDWIELSREFIEEKLKLGWNPMTTQIESHDNAATLLNHMGVSSSIMIDLCRDIWGYVSLGFFGQKVVKGEVGSSTMPHKVNPIDFENAEGNFKLARGIGRTLSDELPISRWQRDLTDSTLQRNLGLVFGHNLLGLQSLLKGLGKLKLRSDVIEADLADAPEVLTEAIQTVLRAYGHHDAYDQLKSFSRGQALTLEQIHEFVEQTDLPIEKKTELRKLTPESYVGLSRKLVEKFVS